MSLKNDYSEDKGLLAELATRIENFQPWPEPVPLEADRPAAFNPDWLPHPLGVYAAAVAESIQVPVDMAALSILSVLALCNSKNYIVQVNPDHVEPLNLFCVIVADPSERKSSVLREVTAPISDYEEALNIQLAPEIARAITAKKILQRELQALEEKSAKDPSFMGAALDKAEELAAFVGVTARRFLADDCTMEKLTSLLCDNRGKLGIFSGEGQIFNVFSGLYSNKESFDVILKAYSSENIRVDRMGRPSESIKSPALTMLLAIQPSVLEEITSNKNFQGRGLIGRILFSLPNSLIGFRKYDSVPIPEQVRRDYNRLIRSLISRDHEEAYPLVLSSGSKCEISQFFNEIETRLIGDMFESRAFGGKLIGLCIRLAGNLHIVKHPEAPEKYPVEADTMRAAIEISRYAISHNFKAMEMVRDSTIEGCRYIVNRIIDRGQRESITFREIQQTCQRYSSKEELTPFIEKLVEYGYLEPTEEERTGPGRPSEVYLINPFLFKAKVTYEWPNTSSYEEAYFQGGELVL